MKCTDVYATISDPTWYDHVSSFARQRYWSVLACEFTGKLSNPPLSRCYILSLRLRDPSFINNQLLNLLIEINDWLVWMEIDCVTRLCRVPSSPISSSESRDLINLYFQLNKLKIFIDKTMICYPWYFNYLIPSHRHVAEIGLEAEKCIPQWIKFLQVWVIC